MPPAKTQSGRGDNFFKDDPDLQRQMGNLDGVSSKADFIKWRSSFLEVVDAFLDQEGSTKAAEAYTLFTTHVRSLQKTKQKLQTCLDNGSLSAEKASVKARRALSELQASLANVTAKLQQLLPGNKSVNVGYSNYHMGAMLVREGFQSYGSLQECDESLLLGKEEALQFVADKQLLQEIDNYHEKLQTFVAIMSDLGLMKIAIKAQEIAKLDKESGGGGDGADEEDDLMQKFTAATTAKLAAPEPTPIIVPPSPEPEPELEPERTPVEPEPVPMEIIPVPEPEPITPPEPEQVAEPGTVEPIPEPEPVPMSPPAVKEESSVEQQRVITITTSHKSPRKAPNGAAPKKIIRRRKKPVDDDPDDNEPDLPRTMKPKAKAQFGNNVGRGAGRMLSKEEAKERRPASKTRPKKRAVPTKKSPEKTSDEADKDDENEEDENEDDNDEDEKNDKDDNGNKKEQAPRQPQGAKQNGQATTKNHANKSRPGATTAATKRQPQATKKKADPQVPIVVHKMDGTQIKLMIDLAKDTLGDVKKQLLQKTKIPIDQQRISMKYSGQEFSVDGKKISFYGVKQDSDVDLDLQWIHVKVEVTVDGKQQKHEIKVLPASDTVNTIKAKIGKESGLPAGKHVLIFKSAELSEGSKTAKAVGIQDGSTLKVEQCSKVSIFVKTMDNAKLILMVNLSKDGLVDIKKQLEKDTGVKESNQRLFLGGAELLDDEKKKKKSLVPVIMSKKDKNKAIETFGIEAGSELDMEPKKLNVIVEMPNGKSHKIKVTPSSDMSDLIALMVEKQADLANISGGKVLKFGGKTFPKGKTVKQMGLRDGSKVKLELT